MFIKKPYLRYGIENLLNLRNDMKNVNMKENKIFKKKPNHSMI